jgi:hypothetical protein
MAMVVLRATQKLLKSWPVTAEDDDVSSTALGDWYANRIVIDRRHLVLLLSANSRLAVLTSARDVRSLPARLPGLVAARLGRLGIAERIIRLEVGAMSVARVGRTKDRSLTGQMVDFAKAIPYYLPVNDWDESSLELAEDRLSETPCLCGRSFAETIFPADMTKRLLNDQWQPMRAVS